MAAHRPSPARRVGNRLLLVWNLAVANAAAAFAVVAFLRPTFVGGDPGAARSLLLSLETGAAWGVFLGGLALLLTNFAWLVRRPERLPPGHWVLSETPTGSVRIAREALENGLQKAGEALPEVTRLRVQVDLSAPKRLLLVGQFQCAEGTNNLAASQRLRQALLDRFGSMVRTTDGVQVEVDLEFQGFAGKLGKKAAEVPAPDDGAPFTGPKYPIDDDQSLGSTT
jgi:xanthine/CO dehydrogenase XdhC/CoxF family maturation factor